MGFLFEIIKPRIFSRINKLERKIIQMFEELKAQVEKSNSVMESAIILIVGLHDKLDAAGTDAEALKALKDSLAAETEKLAAAVEANTVAE